MSAKFRESSKGRRKYLLRDINDNRWYKTAENLDYVRRCIMLRSAENPKSVFQLYRMEKGSRRYEPIPMPPEALPTEYRPKRYNKKYCTRNGVQCGHRRSAVKSSTETWCHYLLDTGKKRGCPPGEECTKFTAEICHEKQEVHNFDWKDFTLQNFY